MCVVSFLRCFWALTGSLVHERAEIAVDAATLKIMQPVYEARREAVKSLPRFWGTALAQHSQLAILMAGQDDMRALAHLTDLSVQYDPVEPRAFTIIFVSVLTRRNALLNANACSGILRKSVFLGQGLEETVQVHSARGNPYPWYWSRC